MIGGAIVVNGVYLLGAVVLSPMWLTRMIRTGKIKTDWPARFGKGRTLPPARGPRVLLHAVSVGEVNATLSLIDELRHEIESVDIVVATTTDTGFARACQLFAAEHEVVRFPFDFSWSVRRFLDRVQPDVVGLMELELWPNMLAQCEARSLPVAVLNGRLSDRSLRRYRRVPRWLRRLLVGRVTRIAAQDDTYAERFCAVGAAEHCVQRLGNMKWDTARIADEVEDAASLAEAMGIDRAKPLVVAGSTCPIEHELLQDAVGEGVQLLCAPRKPEWFDDAARVLTGCARRSKGDRGSTTGRFLLDTIGELRQAYALADVVVVGRTFADLGGSDMIEPIALGKATIVGPDTRNFASVTQILREADGLETATKETLGSTLRALLDAPERRRALADAGRRAIRAEQGASRRHAALLHALIEDRTAP